MLAGVNVRVPVVQVVGIALLSCAGCDREQPARSETAAPTTSRPARPQREPPPERTRVLPPAQLDLDSGVHEPAATKTWTTDLSHPASALHVTPNGTIVVIGPRRITAFDSRGRQRWYRNLAPGDRVLPSGQCLFVQTADHRLLQALDDRGGTRWEREVDGELAPLGSGMMLTIDAAAVHVIECRDGQERWMFSPDRQRSLRLLRADESGPALIGEIGRRRFLFSLGFDGQVRASLELPPATQDAMLVGSGWILARTTSTLTVVDQTGRPQWTQPVTARTEVAYHRGTVILADGLPDGRIDVRALDRTGVVVQEHRFDAGAEPVTMQILASDEAPLLVAACTGALRTCSERGLSSAPFNQLWGCHSEGPVTSVLGHDTDLYFDVAQHGPTTIVVGSTSSGSDTAIIQIGLDLRGTTLARFSGRRMLGPIRGPGSSWLIATCQGHHCQQPWQLHAVEHRQER